MANSLSYLPAWKFEPNVVTKFQPVIFPNAAVFLIETPNKALSELFVLPLH